MSVSRPLLALTLTSLLISGCRSCSGSDAPVSAKEKKLVRTKMTPKQRSKQKDRSDPAADLKRRMAVGRKGRLLKLPMQIVSAPEEARTVAPEVDAARTLILTPTEDGAAIAARKRSGSARSTRAAQAFNSS